MPFFEANSQLDSAIIELLDIGALSEFELIKALQQAPYQIFNEHIFKNDLSLFQTHFIVYNALFRLRDLGLEHHLYDIDILPTKISKINISPNTQAFTYKLEKTSEILSIAAAPETEKLREYYLDWQNLKKTDEHEVEMLLNSFWRKMSVNGYLSQIDGQEINQALTTLEWPIIEFSTLGASESELSKLPSKTELKSHFRKLCQTHHPDKGGDTAKCQKILLSYELLSNIIKS